MNMNQFMMCRSNVDAVKYDGMFLGVCKGTVIFFLHIPKMHKIVERQ